MSEDVDPEELKEIEIPLDELLDELTLEESNETDEEYVEEEECKGEMDVEMN